MPTTQVGSDPSAAVNAGSPVGVGEEDRAAEEGDAAHEDEEDEVIE